MLIYTLTVYLFQLVSLQVLMRCLLVPLQTTGRLLRWQVEISGQISGPSQQTTSYAVPEIESINPLIVETAKAGTNLLTVTGLNFGPENHGKVLFNGIYQPILESAGHNLLVISIPHVSCFSEQKERSK